MSLSSGRVRRALASLLTLVFLALYVWAAIEIGTHIPDNPWVELLYYGLAGTHLGRSRALAGRHQCAPGELGA
jgi:hypothetical protein